MASKNKKALAAKGYRSVHCLKIPLHENSAVLPNAAVAEVIAFSEPAAVDDAPEWFLGYMTWRDLKVPMISLEAASGDGLVSRSGPRIAVLNTLNSNPRVPYIAILLQGVPSLTQLQPDLVEWNEDKQSENNSSVAGYIVMGGEAAMIPDIDDLERRVGGLHV